MYQHSDGKYYEYPEFSEMQDPKSIQTNDIEKDKKMLTSIIQKHISKPSEIYKNIESPKPLQNKVTISSRKPGEMYNPAPITYFDPTSTSLTRFQNKLHESQTNVVQNEFLEPQQNNDELDDNTISTIQDNEPQVLVENIYPKSGWLSRKNIRQKIKEQNHDKSLSSKFTKKNKKP